MHTASTASLRAPDQHLGRGAGDTATRPATHFHEHTMLHAPVPNSPYHSTSQQVLPVQHSAWLT